MTNLYNFFSQIPVFGQILTGANLGIKVAEGAAIQTGKKLADQILNKVGLDSKEAKLLAQINSNLKEFSELMEQKLTTEEKEELSKTVRQIQKVGDFSSDNEQTTKKEANSEQNIGNNSNRNKQHIS